MRLQPSLRLAAAGLALAVAAGACGPAPVQVTPSPLPSAEATATAMPAPTPDDVPPTVVAREPAPGAVIATSDLLRVTFSEAVSGVDPNRFQLRDPDGAVVPATVTLDPERRIATLAPEVGLTVATAYTAALTGAVQDEAGNALTALSWSLTTTDQVSFGTGAYTGYRFAASSAHLTAVLRGSLSATSSAAASEFRVIDGQGYLLMATGIWEGYLVHGEPWGVAQDDAEAPIPPLPACDYVDIATARAAAADWAATLLDTVFQLPSGYVPPELVSTSTAGLNGGHLIRSIALDDLSALVAAATEAGAHLAVQSAYRSYTGQVLTFNGWVEQVGYDAALQTSARPGHSEHQLGTAIDFRSENGPAPWTLADWGATADGAWLAANAWRFGWVMSYPRGTKAVSCYRYEPWHYRYVGRATAAAVHDSGVTLREWLWSEGYGVR